MIIKLKNDNEELIRIHEGYMEIRDDIFLHENFYVTAIVTLNMTRNYLSGKGLTCNLHTISSEWCNFNKSRRKRRARYKKIRREMKEAFNILIEEGYVVRA